MAPTHAPPSGGDPAAPRAGRSGATQKVAWHLLTAAEAAEKLGSSLSDGLTPDEAAARLGTTGPNKLAEVPRPPMWKRFVAQVTDFTVLALLAAAAIAGTLAFLGPGEGTSFLTRYGDSLAILAIVVLNAVLGLAQERRAEKALDALRDMTAPTAKALRSRKIVEIPAAELVPGDILILEEGDRVPADVRLVLAQELQIEEAPLTGESVPVRKDANATLEPHTPLAERVTMAFMATQVSRGRGRGLVTTTGMQTELGSIAGLLAGVEQEETPLEKDLDAFGKRVVIGCVIISLVVFAVGMGVAWSHHSDLGRAARELFLVAVALAVAAIPEGLPAVTTIVLALGTQRMAKRRALVRRLPAVETLGCTQVICTDKTGTLTQNRMTARRLYVGGARYVVSPGALTLGPGLRRMALPLRTDDEPAEEADIMLALRSAGHAMGARSVPRGDGTFETQGDPTDAALLGLAWKCGQTEQRPMRSELPFSSDRRMASVVVEEEHGPRSYVRGAPEAVLARATHIQKNGVRPLGDAGRKAILDAAVAWSAEAMRVIAVAYKEMQGADGDPEAGLVFLGLVAIVDPPRPEVAAAIAEAREAGIKTMMITGDHPATAKAIAEELKLWQHGDELLTGYQIDGMEQPELVSQVDRVRVVARATAEHKLRIVEALKARGLICAMTGDGVNDAPAVKSANIGVAMGRTGTDVTKEAADLVLADDNYATIVAAVEEGRAIYANIRKFIFFLLSSNAGIVLVVLAASLLGWHSPLAPIQILWINLITNGLPALALGIDGRDPDEMKRPPREPGGSILSKQEYLEMLVVGVIMAVTALWAFHHMLVEVGGAAEEVQLTAPQLDRARTVCFAILAIAPLRHAFNCRSKTKSLFALGVFTNRALWGSVLVGLLLEAATIYVPPLRTLFRTVPLDGEGALWIAVMSLVPFVIGEGVKLVGVVPSARVNKSSAK